MEAPQRDGDEAKKISYLWGKLDASCAGSPAATSHCRIAQADEQSAAGPARKDGLKEEERMASKKRENHSKSVESWWTVSYSKKRGRKFYYNRVTGVSRWSKPDSGGSNCEDAS